MKGHATMASSTLAEHVNYFQGRDETAKTSKQADNSKSAASRPAG
jgi:hypothetical protein